MLLREKSTEVSIFKLSIYLASILLKIFFVLLCIGS